MPGLYEYTIQMNDKASGTLQKLTGSSFEAVQKFVQLEDKTAALKRSVGDFGNSIGTLKQKIDLLQQERELLDPKNLTTIRQYNKEIANLNKTINKLETDTGGSKLSKNFKDAFQQIPGAGLITNPLVAIGAGVAGVGKMSMDWQTGMAKINTTAQLSDSELQKLSQTIKRIGTDAKADLRGVPTAYESILSQTNDVTLSNEILMSSLKGSRAGFTEVEVTSKALAQSISAIGKGKATAAEVMDTLFAAKRVGAGEFVDFANNIPGLIASGKNVDVTWREVSGAFAYMTGKGNDAAQSTMLLQNAFTALGKSEITGGLKAAGVDVYNSQGKLRGILPIMTDLSNLMATMSPEQKSNFFEKIGLKDAQAKQAFSVLTDETSKLKEAMDATANSTGEMQKAFNQTNTAANKLKDLWHSLQKPMITIGDLVLSVINPVFFVLGGLITGIAWSIESVGTAWNWWTGLLQEGNPLIWGLTILIGGLTAAISLHNLWLQKDVIWTGIVTASKATWAAVTGVLTGATWGLNTALLANPVTWVVVGIMALVGAFVAAWNYSEKFRAAITGCWDVVKGFGSIIKDFVIDRIKGILSGLGGLASAFQKLLKLDFSGAKTDAKNAFSDLVGVDAMKNAIDGGKQLGDKFRTGYAKGITNFAESKKEAGYIKDEKTGEWVKASTGSATDNKSALAMPDMPALTNPNIDDLLSKLDKTKKGKKAKNDALKLGVPQDYNQTNAYSSITSKFGAQVDLAMSGQETNRPENKTEKPIINMASRVEEIAGSLRKIAAVAALPVMMTIASASTASTGSANVGTGLNPVVNNNHITDARNMVDAPVANTTNQDNAIYNAFDNRLFQNSQQVNDLSRKISSTSSLTDISTSSMTAITDLSRKIDHVSNVNTDLSRKINQVSSTNSLTGDTTNTSNTDLSRKVSSTSSLTNNSLTNSLANTDLSRKINQNSSTNSMTGDSNNTSNTDLSREVNQSNTQLENSFANTVANTDLSRKMDSSTSSLTDISTSSMTNTDLSRKVNQSNTQLENSFANSVANTDMSRKMDQVSSTNSLTGDINNTSNTDLSRKVNQSSTQLENSLANSVANTDLSRKMDQVSNSDASSTSSQTDNSLSNNTAETANSYDGSTITNSDVNNRTATQSSVSTTNNNQRRTVHFDRFTDKIEIHVTGADSPQLAAEQIRDAVERAIAEILNV